MAMNIHVLQPMRRCMAMNIHVFHSLGARCRVSGISGHPRGSSLWGTQPRALSAPHIGGFAKRDSMPQTRYDRTRIKFTVSRML